MPSSKHLGYSDDLVLTFLRGLVSSNPSLKLLEQERVIFSAIEQDQKVLLLSGGGSGHEPAHAGYIGDGMLDIAVAGSIFASPSTKQIVAGIRSKPSKAGILVIVKNYTGDVMHFGLAAERAKASGIDVEVVIVGDDVAVGRTKGALVGRRALAGTVLVHKAAGAEAALGSDLKQVTAIAQSVSDNLVTIGASLDHCSVPGREIEQFLLPNEIEIGMGIHNEPGIKRVSPVPNAAAVVNTLLRYLLSSTDPERSYVPFLQADDVVLLINNLGGLSILEISAITHIVISQLRETYKIEPVRTYVGTFMTSLNAPGFSVTLLNATKAGGAHILDLLDAETTAPGWTAKLPGGTWAISKYSQIVVEDVKNRFRSPSHVKTDPATFAKILESGCHAVLKKVPDITRYDTVAGDGDCGETLESGANAILTALKEQKEINLSDGVLALNDLAELVESSMGGTSGGIYSIYISALAQGLRKIGDENGQAVDLSLPILAKASQFALTALYKYTKARVGDRTLIDTLAPFVEVLASGSGTVEALKLAVYSAAEGVEKTKKLEAKLGRASYVGKEELAQFDAEGGLPDPGAVGVAALLEGFVEAYIK
ncbi:Dak1 domain-containing protein [Lipomyces chichibuensis]|uniref:Dak1 domain-containing protein n=1 Tax=Lipomyces chichibuensis TaxID=1546026 RepID=UPI003343F318